MPYKYHRQDGKDAVKSFETALEATRQLLKENLTRRSFEATMNPPGTKTSGGALRFLLNVLKPDIPPVQFPELLDGLKEATHAMKLCQQNNEHTFKRVWYLYVTCQRYPFVENIGIIPGRVEQASYPSVDDVGIIQDRSGQVVHSVLHAFHVHPFAISPEGDGGVNLPTLAILNHNHDTVTRYEKLARRIGKTWVDDRIPRRKTKIGALQISLFELLWSGTVEQLKSHSVHSANDPEQAEYVRAVEELEKTLRRAIVHSKRQRFVITFCGMVDAGKSTFLNALMGRAILPSHGETISLAHPLYYN